jgi:hypothetical protein
MRCILHIGTEKTGTTLLQQWLYENRQALSQQGVALTTGIGKPNNRKLVARFQDNIDEYMHMLGVFTEAERETYFAGLEDAFLAEIDALRADHHTVVITSEHFHSRLRAPDGIRQLHALLARSFDDFRVICYFREQSLVRTSLYSTALKVQSDRPITAFQEQVGPQNHYYNYLDFFRKWEDVFGIEALRPRLFDRAHLTEGDIRRDFLACALPGIDARTLGFETVTANESLNTLQAFFFRVINAARPKMLGHYTDPTPHNIKDVLLDATLFPSGGKIPDPRQVALYEAFDSSNTAFFARYFGEERNLFEAPPAVDGPAEPAPEPESVGLVELEGILTALLKTEGLIVLKRGEVDMLRNLSQRLLKDGQITPQEALGLVKIAHRARPEGGFLKERIQKLRARVMGRE